MGKLVDVRGRVATYSGNSGDAVHDRMSGRVPLPVPRRHLRILYCLCRGENPMMTSDGGCDLPRDPGGETKRHKEPRQCCGCHGTVRSGKSERPEVKPHLLQRCFRLRPFALESRRRLSEVVECGPKGDPPVRLFPRPHRGAWPTTTAASLQGCVSIESGRPPGHLRDGRRGDGIGASPCSGASPRV